MKALFLNVHGALFWHEVGPHQRPVVMAVMSPLRSVLREQSYDEKNLARALFQVENEALVTKRAERPEQLERVYQIMWSRADQAPWLARAKAVMARGSHQESAIAAAPKSTTFHPKLFRIDDFKRHRCDTITLFIEEGARPTPDLLDWAGEVHTLGPPGAESPTRRSADAEPPIGARQAAFYWPESEWTGSHTVVRSKIHRGSPGSANYAGAMGLAAEPRLPAIELLVKPETRGSRKESVILWWRLPRGFAVRPGLNHEEIMNITLAMARTSPVGVYVRHETHEP